MFTPGRSIGSTGYNSWAVVSTVDPVVLYAGQLLVMTLILFRFLALCFLRPESDPESGPEPDPKTESGAGDTQDGSQDESQDGSDVASEDGDGEHDDDDKVDENGDAGDTASPSVPLAIGGTVLSPGAVQRLQELEDEDDGESGEESSDGRHSPPSPGCFGANNVDPRTHDEFEVVEDAAGGTDGSGNSDGSDVASDADTTPAYNTRSKSKSKSTSNSPPLKLASRTLRRRKV